MKRLVSSDSFICEEMDSSAVAFCSREMVGSLMKRPKSALSCASFCTCAGVHGMIGECCISVAAGRRRLMSTFSRANMRQCIAWLGVERVMARFATGQPPASRNKPQQAPSVLSARTLPLMRRRRAPMHTALGCQTRRSAAAEKKAHSGIAMIQAGHDQDPDAGCTIRTPLGGCVRSGLPLSRVRS